MSKTAQVFLPLVILGLLIVLSTPALAQKQPSEEDLVKQTQNPVADLISVPFRGKSVEGRGMRVKGGVSREKSNEITGVRCQCSRFKFKPGLRS